MSAERGRWPPTQNLVLLPPKRKFSPSACSWWQLLRLYEYFYKEYGPNPLYMKSALSWLMFWFDAIYIKMNWNWIEGCHYSPLMESHVRVVVWLCLYVTLFLMCTHTLSLFEIWARNPESLIMGGWWTEWFFFSRMKHLNILLKLQIAFLTLRPIQIISICSCKIHFDNSLAGMLLPQGSWSPANVENCTDTILCGKESCGLRQNWCHWIYIPLKQTVWGN